MSGASRKSLATPADSVKATNVVVTDSEDSAVTRVGTWTSTAHKSATDLTYIYSETALDYLEFKFKGTGVWLRYYGLPDGGKTNVSIDGGAAKTLETYAISERVQIAFVASNLSLDEHKVKVEVAGQKIDASTGYKVAVDAFIVELSRGAIQIWAMVEEALVMQPTEFRTTGSHSGSVILPIGETIVYTINGSGRVLRITCFTSHSSIEIRFAVDDVTVNLKALLGVDTLSAGYLNTYGFTSTTPQIQLLKYTEGGSCLFSLQVEFEFKQNFIITAYQTIGTDTYSTQVGIIYVSPK